LYGFVKHMVTVTEKCRIQTILTGDGITFSG
jgi:hypothetical protein